MELTKLRQKLMSTIGKYRYVLLVLFIGIGLMLLPELSKEEKSNGVVINESKAPDLTASLTEILSKMDGVGKVCVMLTEDYGEEYVYQSDTGSQNQKDTVIITDSDRTEQGLIQKTLAPRYRGAVIVCEGAERVAVRLSIIEAVADATGLSTDRICVVKMK